MKQIEFHPEARAEAKSAFGRHWDLSQSVALGFDAEPRAAYSSIQKSPNFGPLYLQGTRRVILDRYPFSVVFRERLYDIQIIAVAHAKRRPGYWAKRLKQ